MTAHCSAVLCAAARLPWPSDLFSASPWPSASQSSSQLSQVLRFTGQAPGERPVP
eukprot:CAMPEP_0171208832 /NCGR_PEP_ID=MMETSP0790-20130122/28288_1 /TAXON_ID=2925 /ORGANISM="Alexandrium catenella, Strain OF101" /LENGTH=54 /DNA_ID=CAMNT_0011674433 /DNA_START=59 /DNA_END=219 /DNA_ORIENTATION=+